MKNHIVAILALLATAFGATAAHAQAPAKFGCGGVNPFTPTIAPVPASGGGDFTNLGFECAMWQDFVYLNWPALKDQRGAPDTNAKFGAPGATVWETYKTDEQTFLPNGANPGPWNQGLAISGINKNLAQLIASGDVRRLTETSKISRVVLRNAIRQAKFLSARAGANATMAEILKAIQQAGGGVLYDLNGKPVYYEISMDQVQYEYIVQNGLYNAATQIAYAGKTNVSLPSAPTPSSPIGSLEVKAAWKVLSQPEIDSKRFHMIQALLPKSTAPVTVGLVGFHMFLPDGAQGIWATFAQIDNAPVQGTPPGPGPYNFYNPNCTVPGGTKPCPINVKNANPGQVVQINPDDASAGPLNAYMQSIIKQYDPATPWQYYKIVDVQWAKKAVEISTLPVPAQAPLPNGSPNAPNVVNAVLETFLQKPQIGCLFCHTGASGPSPNTYATSYSFVFEHATAPPK